MKQGSPPREDEEDWALFMLSFVHTRLGEGISAETKRARR